MNVVYAKIAKWFNDLENYRTDTQWEDGYIIKTFVFQFANSYGAVFYIAFVKALGLSPFSAFGYTDVHKKAYGDTCGCET